MFRRLIAILLPASLLAGCATVPTPLTGDYSPISPTMVRQQHAGIGQTVRWGGSIINVNPYEQRTCLEILHRPLDGSARPRDTDGNQGRFIACKAGFLDPAAFDAGRDVTVIGRITGVQTGKIGEYEYHYPRLDAGTVYLWPPREEYRYRYYPAYDPFFYDPLLWPFPYHPGFYPPHPKSGTGGPDK